MKFRHLNFRAPSRACILSSGDERRLRHAYHSDGYGVYLLIGLSHNESMSTLDFKLPTKNTNYVMVMYGLYSRLCSHSLGQKPQPKLDPTLMQSPLSQGAALLAAGRPPCAGRVFLHWIYDLGPSRSYRQGFSDSLNIFRGMVKKWMKHFEAGIFGGKKTWLGMAPTPRHGTWS